MLQLHQTDNMSEAKKQHYVPKFYLKAFAETKNGEYFTHCFDKSAHNQYKVNIKDIGCENYFYGASKPLSQKLEKLLAEFDSKFTRVYDKLSTYSLGALRWKEKEVFAQFITIQELRTREMREYLRQTAMSLKNWIEPKIFQKKCKKRLTRLAPKKE
jgi:hypothetical protein